MIFFYYQVAAKLQENYKKYYPYRNKKGATKKEEGILNLTLSTLLTQHYTGTYLGAGHDQEFNREIREFFCLFF